MNVIFCLHNQILIKVGFASFNHIETVRVFRNRISITYQTHIKVFLYTKMVDKVVRELKKLFMLSETNWNLVTLQKHVCKGN